jgi:hypothetical protein
MEEAKELHEAILSAFPNVGSLEEVLYFYLGEHLTQVAGGQTYTQVVKNLIIWAEAEGRTDDLITGARKVNPGNIDLKRFEERYRQGLTTTEPAGSTYPIIHPKATANQPTQATPVPIRILFLAANPRQTEQLRLDEEVRTIDERLRLAQFRDRFDLVQHWAVRTSDLSEVLLRHTPHIVHFSGHGSDQGEIILEDAVGSMKPVSPAALGRLFRTLKDNIRCVMLNACFSATQAEAIVKEIDCVAGMSKAIGDAAAIRFAAGFYQALGYGRSIQTAFDLGITQIGLDGLAEEATPQLLTKPGVDPNSITFAS